MAATVGARYGISFGYAPGESGWSAGVDYDLAAIEALVCPWLLSTATATPPASPAEGDTYQVATGGTGAWAGEDGKLAAWQGGVWNFYPVAKGLRVRIVDQSGFFYWNGSWVAEAGSSSGAVTSVAARTGDVVLTVADVAGAAPTASPTFSGAPTAPTQAVNDASTKLATTGYVDRAVTGGFAPVSSVAGRTGAITLTHTDLTDWTSATSAFLTSAPVTSVAGRTGAITLVVADVTGAAPLASPAFTGTPNAPTAADGDNSTLLATTAFVHQTVADVVGAAPAALDTLKELADALGDDANYAATMTTALAAKAPLASPAFNGTPTAPVAPTNDNTLTLANTSWVQTYVASLGYVSSGTAPVTSVAGKTGAVQLNPGDVPGVATLISPVFAGTPTTPTPDGTDNTLTLANTSWVRSYVASLGYATTSASVSWTQLPAEAQNLPLGFVLPGKPTAGQVYNLVMAMAVTLPANFAGSVGYAGTVPTAGAAFTLNKIAGGVTTTALGTLTFAAGMRVLTLSTQAGASLAAGDVLQLVAPATQDATLSDLGITILAAKV